MQGVTPDSLLALHGAGYRAVLERLGPGRVLDIGCGQGFESVGFGGEGRRVFGVDYSAAALQEASSRWSPEELLVAQMDAGALGMADQSVDWVCSSHLIEHFVDPAPHVSEVARVLRSDGTAFFITPNAPADFENPFHVHPFEPDHLRDVLGRHFGDVTILGIDAVARVKDDFRSRRERAARLLALDVFHLRHRIPRSWYVGAYTRILPVAYGLIARSDTGGLTGITADDFFVTEDIDTTTLVLFALARHAMSR